MENAGSGFPERLRQVIEKTGKDRVEFASAVGVSKAQIYNYLGGKQQPGLSFLVELKQQFKWVDIEWLVSGKHGDARDEVGGVARPLWQIELLDQVDSLIQEKAFSYYTTSKLEPDDERLKRFKFWLDRIWKTGDEQKRERLFEGLQRCFPEFADHLKESEANKHLMNEWKEVQKKD